jgi:hypothetical protein
MPKPVSNARRSARPLWMVLAFFVCVPTGPPATEAATGAAASGGELIASRCVPYSRARDICHFYVLAPSGRVKRRLPSRLNRIWGGVFTRDGRWVAWAGRPYDLHVSRADGTDASFLVDGTLHSGVDHPRWIPDGHRLVWRLGDFGGGGSNPGDRNGPYVATRDGTSFEVERFVSAPPLFLDDFSPDGGMVVGQGPGATIDQGPYRPPLQLNALDIADLRTGGITRLVDDTVDLERQRPVRQAFAGKWSPDGRWIAFIRTLNEGTAREFRQEVWLIRPDGTGLHQLSPRRWNVDGGLWSPDSRTLLFVRILRRHLNNLVTYTIQRDGSHLKRFPLTPRTNNELVGISAWLPKLHDQG